MSTYTDLHNKVKENIAVDYHNRITPQRVRLFNEENEYWGTFKGHVTAEDIKIKGGEISGATLYDAKLSGNINIPGIGDLSAYRETMEEVSGMAYNAEAGLIIETQSRISADAEINAKIDRLSLSSISADVLSIVNDVSTLIEQNYAHILSGLSSVQDLKLSAEISARISADEAEQYTREEADNYISGQIEALRSDFDAETIKRENVDNTLSIQIKNLRAQEENDVSQLAEALDQHEQANIAQFAEAREEMLSTVAHDKHYAIYGSAEGLFNSYPYQLKDFAMNVIQTSLNTAYIVDPRHGNVVVGKISDEADKTYVQFYDLENDVELRKMITPLASYAFNSTGKQFVVDGNYMITYDREYSRLIVSPVSTSPYYKLVYGSQEIGQVDNVEIASNNSLISGLLTINTTGELSAFNNFKSMPFSRISSEIAVGAERIEFLGPNYTTFNFRKYVSDIWYCPISAYNQSTGMNQEVARIISGDVRYDSIGHISAIAVECQGSRVELFESSQFATLFADGLMLSCAVIDSEQGSFTLDMISAYYKYKMYEEADAEMTGPVVGYVIPGKANTALSTQDFDELGMKKFVIKELEVLNPFIYTNY